LKRATKTKNRKILNTKNSNILCSLSAPENATFSLR